MADAATGLLCDEILDEAGARHDGGPEAARGARVHVRAAAPAFVGRRQREADRVLDQMRRQIELEVQGPPQGHPHRRAVRRRGRLFTHELAPPFDRA